MPGNRKSIRLKNYDYAQEGAYYVTVCVDKNIRRGGVTPPYLLGRGDRARTVPPPLQSPRPISFGDVQNGEMVLNEYGKIVHDSWQWLKKQYEYVELDEFIIMPDHLHGIINIAGIDSVGARSPRPHDQGAETAPVQSPARTLSADEKGRGDRAPTLGQIVAYFKYDTSKKINAIRNTPGVRFWQRNYWEHVIRSECDLNHIREYIINNPIRWENDGYDS